MGKILMNWVNIYVLCNILPFCSQNFIIFMIYFQNKVILYSTIMNLWKMSTIVHLVSPINFNVLHKILFS